MRRHLHWNVDFLPLDCLSRTLLPIGRSGTMLHAHRSEAVVELWWEWWRVQVLSLMRTVAWLFYGSTVYISLLACFFRDPGSPAASNSSTAHLQRPQRKSIKVWDCMNRFRLVRSPVPMLLTSSLP